VFFFSVFSILRSALRCALVYFFLALSCFFSAFRESRVWDADAVPADARAEALLPHAAHKVHKNTKAAILFINAV
jgi:hypothetical protein